MFNVSLGNAYLSQSPPQVCDAQDVLEIAVQVCPDCLTGWYSYVARPILLSATSADAGSVLLRTDWDDCMKSLCDHLPCARRSLATMSSCDGGMPRSTSGCRRWSSWARTRT